ncbi:MAG: hypothetical protein OEY23_05400 [Acidimicrobiia bacterium]|nr:hypothetical protein [Acidimicrobiia bacterium]
MAPHRNLADEVAAWFAARLPEHWFAAPVRTLVDKDEILVVGVLAVDAGASPAECQAAALRFRAETKGARIATATEAELTWQRKVSWAVECGEVQVRYTTASVPVMTRLRIDERLVLDTLIDAGVARSRSEALGWCVRLVGQHQGDWIARLRQAVQSVEEVRADGPEL